MSTETGVEKRRLSRSSSESEEGAIDIETNEGVKEDDRTKVGTATRCNEDTVVAPTNTNNRVIPGDGSRQIIAVSANKNPTAFFQLARKFLMTNEMCDLSALEGAIVSAVDAAHLLERSKLASIVRIHTSYVNVEPKRRRQVSQQKGEVSSTIITEGALSTSTIENGLLSSEAESSSLTNSVTGTINTEDPSQMSSSLVSSSIVDSKKSMKVSESQQGGQQPTTISTSRNSAPSLSGSGSRELRRARILVTVKRTESYERWLEENPSQRQAIIAGTATVTTEDIVVGVSSSNNDDSTDLPNTMDQTSTSSKN